MSNKKLTLIIISIIAIPLFALWILEKSANSTNASGAVNSPSITTNASTHGSVNTAAESGPRASTADPLTSITLTGFDGSTINLADYRGEKAVILDFWASWCHNCQRAMPITNKFYQKYGDSVEVIGVNLQESKSTISRFVEKNGITFPIALDPRGELARKFGIVYTNTHILIDKNGNIISTIPGDLSEQHFISLIN